MPSKAILSSHLDSALQARRKYRDADFTWRRGPGPKSEVTRTWGVYQNLCADIAMYPPETPKGVAGSYTLTSEDGRHYTLRRQLGEGHKLIWELVKRRPSRWEREPPL